MAFNLRPPWYRLNVSRMEAEEMLIKTNQPGSFIVRESESLQNTRVLSLLYVFVFAYCEFVLHAAVYLNLNS